MGEFAKQVQWRRGTTAEHSTFVGAEGEITIDSTKNTVVVHDGRKVGGYSLPTFSDLLNKADRSELNNYRPLSNKIEMNDLSESLQGEILVKYNDTEIKAEISELKSNKLDRNELANELANYREKNDMINLEDLNTSVQESINNVPTLVTNVSRINTTLESKANSSDLSNYRNKNEKITSDDLNDSLKNSINNISTNTSSINALTVRMSDAEQEIETLKNIGGSSGNVNLDGYVTVNDFNSTISNIEETIAEANRNHATVTKVEGIEEKVNTNTSDIATIKGQIEIINTTIEGLKENSGGSESGGSSTTSEISVAEFNALKTSVEKNTTDISETKTNVSSNTTSISSLDTRVTAVESSVISAKSVAEEAKRTADDLSSSIESAVSNSNTNTTNISNLTTTVEGYSSRLSTAELNASSAKTASEAAITAINSINNNIGSNENSESILGRIHTLENNGTNVSHNNLTGLNEGDYLHLTASEKDDIMGMNSTLAELILNFNALKTQVENGSGSSTASTNYVDNEGHQRTLKYNILFTTNGQSRELKKSNKFKENGYTLPTIEDYLGPNYEDDVYTLSNVEMYYHGIADNPDAVPTWLPRVTDEPLTDKPITNFDYDAETGIITFGVNGNDNIYLLEFRVYEPLN